MSDHHHCDHEEQRDRGGRFVIGGKAGPGRPKGARSKLSEAFLQDVHTVWEKRGLKALEQTAIKKPAEFCRIIALLMPQQATLDVNVVHDVSDALTAFRTMADMLGADPRAGMVRLRRLAPQIEHDDA
jgi:hypothetical protein